MPGLQRATAACARPRGQCYHHRMVAHVVRHEMKSHSKLFGCIFFSAQDIIFCATRTVGMEHRVKCSAAVPPSTFHISCMLSAARIRRSNLSSTLHSARSCQSATSFPHR